MEELKPALADIEETEKRLVAFLNDVLNEPDGVSELMGGRIGRLFELAKCYQSAFNRLNVTSRGEFQDLIKGCYRYDEIRNLDEDIYKLEQQWDEILQKIDQSLKDEDDGVDIGDRGPEQISGAGGRVLVVSFGDLKGAQQWLAETKCPFPMLLDPQRKVIYTMENFRQCRIVDIQDEIDTHSSKLYKIVLHVYTAFGLHRSVAKVWGIEEMVYYAESMAKNIPLPKPSQYVHDDPQQMGGDFIIDKDGIVRYLYCSQKSTDRPSVQDILDHLNVNSS